jgi:glucose/arabinose dehydrogenase
MPRRIPLALLAAFTILTACSSGSSRASRPTTRPSSSSSSSSSSAPTPTPRPDPRRARFRLAPVVEIEGTTAMATRMVDPDGAPVTDTPIPRGTTDDALYVTEQTGRVRAIRGGHLDPTPVLDLTDRVSAGGERGLLGLTFSLDGRTLYVDYTNRDGDTRVDAYPMRGDGTADRGGRRELLAIKQPQPNHNGGNVVIGPDGMLWIGMGDGGAAGDEGPGHAPQGNGQSLDTLLGKLLRIDPRPAGTKAYTIPPDNPFARGGGRPEIYAYGLRNPWRFSFDTVGNAMVIGDVGQNKYEEIDWISLTTRAPWNFGWPEREGTHAFRSGDASGTIGPILDYSHDDGRCAVTGGYVYRGTRIPDLVGTYLYSDSCDGKIRGTAVGPRVVGHEIDFGVQVPAIVSFGQDANGELYVLSQTKGVFQLVPA